MSRMNFCDDKSDSSTKPSETMAKQCKMSVDITQLFEALNNLQKSLECTICLELMTKPMKTRCAHSFCQPCISQVLRNKAAHCPLCQKSLNRRNVSKDDHLEALIKKFKRLVIATQVDTHIDILSYLKQPRDTKESFHMDTNEFGDFRKRKFSKDLSKSICDSNLTSKQIDVTSTSHEMSIDSSKLQDNANSLSKKLAIPDVNPLAENNDEIYSTPNVKCYTWLHTLPENLPMNPGTSIVNDAAPPINVINDNETELINDETCPNETDRRRRTRTRQDKSADCTARIYSNTSRVNKEAEAEARQLGKVEKIDSAAGGLKYIASHARVRTKKRKRTATKSDNEIEEDNNRGSSLLTMAQDKASRSQQSDAVDRLISDATDDRQSIDTNWSRVMEIGKEMHPRKRRKVKKLDVSIEKQKIAPRIVEDLALPPHVKYTLIENATCHDTKEKESTSVSDQESKSRQQDATDKNLSNANQMFMTDSLANSFATDIEGYITLEEGRQVRIMNLNNDQVNRIIGTDEQQPVENQGCKEDAAKRRNDLSQRYKLTVLTPEKLNRSIDECGIARTPVGGKLENSLLAESCTPPKTRTQQKTTPDGISSEFKPPTPRRLSLRRKLIVDDHRRTDLSPSRQLPLSSDKSPVSSREKDTSDRKNVDSPIDDARLPRRSLTVRCDLSSQFLAKDQTPIKRDTPLSKKTNEIKNSDGNVIAEFSETSSSRHIKDKQCEFSVKFVQLGTLIKRRDVKYFYSATTKREHSLPAKFRITSVCNMQRSTSEIEQHVTIKLNNLTLSSDHLQDSNDITLINDDIMEIVSSDSEDSVVTRKNTQLSSIRDAPASTPKKNTDPHSDQKITTDRARPIEHSSTLMDRSNNFSIEKKRQIFSPIHRKKSCADNTVAGRTDRRISRISSETTSSVKLLSPNKDSQLRFLTIDSPMNEPNRQLNDKSVTKENNFSDAKSLPAATSTPRRQEPSSASSEFTFRFGPNKRKKKMKYISDEERFAKSSDKIDNFTDLDDDQRTIKLNKCNSELLVRNAKLNANKKHQLDNPHNPDDEVLDLDSNERNAMKKYKRIVCISSDTDSESSMHRMRDRKRQKMDDQQNTSIANTPKEKYLMRQDTDEDLRIQNIVNKWSSEHNATQKKLIKDSRSIQRCLSEEKLASRRSSRLASSLEADKRSSIDQKISETIESDMFESNNGFSLENTDYVKQQAKLRSQTSQTIADPSNEDIIINRVLQIDRSVPRDCKTTQGKKNSGEHLLYDNFDEVIANVELPQSEDVTPQAEQTNRNLHRTLIQQRTSNRLTHTNESRGIARESPKTISSMDDIFGHYDGPSKKSQPTPVHDIGLTRVDKENIALDDQKRLRDCTNDRRNRKDVEVTEMDLDENDKDSLRKATSKRSASREKKISFNRADECLRIDKERNVSARSANCFDERETQGAASDESKNNSFEDDTLMDVTQDQIQLQLFEEDLFGIPTTRNRAEATKVASQDDLSQKQQEISEKRKPITQDKKTAVGECFAEEDDIVENTPERKIKHGNVTAVKSRKNIAMLYSSPMSNRSADRTPSTSDVSRKKDTPKSGMSTPMSRLEMFPLYQSTPKVAHASATTIKRLDASTGNKKTESTANSGTLSMKQADSGTLENARRRADGQKLCFVCSGLTVAQVKHVREFAVRYNAHYVNQFEASVTHIIVNTIGVENVTKSTLKYLQGIAHRKWIVSYRWIEDCDKERRLLNEISYEATMHYDGVNGNGPRNSRLREKGLFEGFTFLCIGPYVNVTLNQYQDLLLATGATVVDSLKTLAQKGGLKGIVIQDNTHDNKIIERWYRVAKAAPIIVDWIVECIGQYRIFKLAPYIQCLSLQDFYAIGYPRELVEDEDSDDET